MTRETPRPDIQNQAEAANDFVDKLIDFVNEQKVTTIVVMNACVRIAAYVAIKGGSDAESFADGARRTFEQIATGGRS
jgi:predicted ATP-grasp superfamily ATP-dependent carboligase